MGLYGTIEPQAPVASRELSGKCWAGTGQATSAPAPGSRDTDLGFWFRPRRRLADLASNRAADPGLEVASVVASHDGDEYSLRQGNGIPWMK